MVADASTILVLQPEKPDSDSLASSLTLEQILGDMGKMVIMYCKDPVPAYLAHYPGLDRVTDEFPDQYDLTLLVDMGGPQGLSRTLEKYQGRLVKKPFAIIDHHANREPMPFETFDIIDPSSLATCEQLFHIAQQLDWPISAEAAELMIPGILADTRNLSIPSVTSDSFRVVADLMDFGANLAAIHDRYRLNNAIEPELISLKGRLLNRMELFAGGKIALVVVSPEELKQYADIHDPSDLVIYDMQRAKGVEVAVVIRHYGGMSNKIKISTRANMPVAAKACQEFGGGGHDRASGCQVIDTPAQEVKDRFVSVLTKHIREYETLQHAH